MKKCAVIRNNENRPCPFGLDIPSACENAGESVAYMCPLKMIEEKKREQVEKANKRVYIHHKTGQRCIYASDIIDQNDSVNCNFGTYAQGLGNAPFEGSPLYPQQMSGGIGLGGLHAFPLGWYSSNDTIRNIPYGLFSLIGEKELAIIKIAINMENNELWGKIENGEVLLTEEQKELDRIVDKCRQEFEDTTDSPAKLRDLSNEYIRERKL